MNQPVRLELPRLHDGQAQLIREAKRFNVACCGRRWGKSHLGMHVLIHAMLNGKSAGWFSPTYKSSSDAWREFLRILQPIQSEVNQQERRLTIRNGASLECWSLDSSDSARGRGFDVLIVDEAAIVPDLEKCWNTLAPMLLLTRGSGWLLSTPRGASTFFHRLWLQGQDPKNREWKSWRMPTASRPDINPQDLESERANHTELGYAEEYEAQFVIWAGAVFRKIQDAVTLSPTGKAAIIGVDWGRTNDFTAITVLSDSGCVLEIDRFRGIEYSLQRARLRALWERHGKPTIIAERNAMGQPVIEQLIADGLPVRPFLTTNESKSQAIEALALAFERGEIQIPDNATLLGELAAFEAQPLPSGLMRYGAPLGAHDDIVMAMAIAWAGLGKATRRVADLASMGSILEANAELARPSQWDMGPCFSEAGTTWTH